MIKHLLYALLISFYHLIFPSPLSHCTKDEGKRALVHLVKEASNPTVNSTQPYLVISCNKFVFSRFNKFGILKGLCHQFRITLQ